MEDTDTINTNDFDVQDKSLDVSEQISRFKEFFEENYMDTLLEKIRKGQDFMAVDFQKLSKFDIDLADLLLDHPEEVLKAAEIAIKEFDLPSEIKRFHVRVHNLPESQGIMVRDIRSKHIGRFLHIIGTVRQKSDVRPQVTTARFECPSCGNVISVLQLDNKFNEPTRCGCGRKGKFRLLSKELVDAQGIVLEEATEDLEGGEQPKRMNIFLKDDLVSPISDRKTNPGTKIGITGVIKEVPIILRSGSQSTKFDLLLEANHVESIEEDFTEIEITSEEEKQIKELSRDPKIYDKLYQSITPSIYGHERVKEALIYQLLGGVNKKRPDGVSTRGDMHVLLVGDPGSGKSMMLKRCSVVAPKCRYVSGKGASGAGLCVSPNSTILTNPGGMEAIEQIVEERLDNPGEYRPGVWKKDKIEDVKIQSLSKNLKLHSKNPASIWKLQAPNKVFEITLSSGKKIELTGNTKLFNIKNGRTGWKKSMNLNVGEYVATPRTLIGGCTGAQPIVDLIESNPVLHNIKPFVKRVAKKLSKKYGTLRNAAKQLKIPENSLYHNWVNENARGNIKLKSLKKICKAANVDWKHHIKTISLCNGKPHKIPHYMDEEFLYVAGLIAGDGDIRSSGSTYSIRLSNSEESLQKFFSNTIKTQFNLKIDVQKGNKQRPTSSRTHSKILGEILKALGIPLSPKSNKISLSNTLLHLKKPLLAQYIAGLYDADGSIPVRKTKGSDCIELTTCSEKLARELQLVFLRFNIHATIRSKEPTKGKIKGKYRRFILEIRGRNQFKKFQQDIPIKHPNKKKNLKILTEKYSRSDTNTDIIPNTGLLLKEELQKQSIPLKKIGWHENLSRNALQNILSKIECNTKTLSDLKEIAFSDIYWEKIVSIEEKNCEYEHVYDLTVEDSHNFVVDGVLVHNTAAVVKDEFLNGWSLEAGALVLANNGFCLTKDTEILTDNTFKTIKELHDLFKKGKNTKIKSIDYDSLKFLNSKIKNFSKRKAKTFNLSLETGDQLNITEEHPILIWNNGYSWKETKEVKCGDYVITKRFFPLPDKYPLIIDLVPKNTFVKLDLNRVFPNIKKSSITNTLKIPKHRLEPKNKLTIRDLRKISNYLRAPYEEIKQNIIIEDLPKRVTPALGEFIGLILTDGSLSKEKSTIRFYNKSEELLSKYKKLVFDLFKITPSTYLDTRNGIEQCFFSSKNVHKLLQKFGVKAGNKSKAPLDLNLIRIMPKEFTMAFFCNVINGDGAICNRKSGGLISIVGGNKHTLEQIRRAIRPLGILSRVAEYTAYGGEKIIKKGEYKNFKLNITGISNFKLIDSKYLIKRKAANLHDILKSKDTSLRVPKTYKLFKDLNSKIPHSEKKILYKNSIRLANLRNMSLSREVFENTTRQLAEVNPAKYTEEVKLFKKIINQDMIFLKVVDKKDAGVKEVFNLQVDMISNPNYFANFIPVHNCMIDELDKMSHEDRSAMHEALEQQSVTISKANIQATLQCKTTVLAAANPKFGRFDPYELLAKQIDLPPSLINRFDLIFPIRDLPEPEKDEKLAKFVLNLHQASDIKDPEIPSEMLKKFIVFARRRCKPVLSETALDEIKNYYVKMRNAGTEEGGVQPIPISARQLEALVRLSEASAKARLSDKVTKKDAKRAIELLHYCLSQIGLDPDTGKIDIDRISSGITASQRNQIGIIKEIIRDLEDKVGKVIPIDDIIKEAETQDIKESTVEEVIEKLKRSGDVFEPKRSFISRI